MSARIFVVALATVALAAACGAQSSGGAAGGSGLYGTVRIKPGSPVCQAGTTCSRPAARFKLVFSANGKTVTATTDRKGRYRVRLDRGRYTVRSGISGTSPKRGLQPKSVNVARGRYSRRNFVYDSGIR